MFTPRFFIAALCLFSLLSCSKKDSKPEEINKLLDGTWRVMNYAYNSNDRTSDLSDYTFAFTSDKKIVATKQDTSVSGTWYSARTPRVGEGPFAEGGDLYIEFKFISLIPAFVDISKQWKPYMSVAEASLITFDGGMVLTLVKN